MGFLDVLASLVGPVLSYFGQERTNEANAELVEQNQQWQEKMIDKQNEYNSPANQMQRLKDAGINPATFGMASGNLASGNLSGSPNASPVIPQSNSLGNLSSDIHHIMSAFQSQQEGLDKKTFREVTLEKTQEEINQLKANTELIGLNAQAQQIVNTYAAAREQYAIAEADGRVKKLFSDMNLNLRQMSYLNSQIKEIEFRISEVLPVEINKIVADTGVSYLEQDKH